MMDMTGLSLTDFFIIEFFILHFRLDLACRISRALYNCSCSSSSSMSSSVMRLDLKDARLGASYGLPSDL